MSANNGKIFSEYCKKKKIDEKLISDYIELYNNINKQDKEKIKEEIEKIIAVELFNLFKKQEKFYSKEKVKEYSEKFEWQKKNATESLKIRNNKAKEFQNWIKKLTNQSKPDLKEAENMFNHVLEWGFGTKNFFNGKKYINNKQKKVGELKDFCKFINDWNKGDRKEKRKNSEEKRKSHLNILNISGVGIARSSKWICFIDQENYAIYDSRVSLALSKIINEKKKKPFFQVLKRRDLKTKKYPKGSSRSKSLTVDDYFIFLKFINKVADDYKMKPFEVEMSLFMMGDNEKYYKHLFELQ